MCGNYIEDMIGKVFQQVHIVEDTNTYQGEMIVFTCKDNTTYTMNHDQDCCENVYIEDIVGDLEDIICEPILLAECVTEENANASDAIGQWTFYKLATVKGYVTLRWYGESNGCYSVKVDLKKTLQT